MPDLIAHRGHTHLYPENTLASLAAAARAGARFVEFDVQLSKDRVPVLMHDPDLHRTTGRRGRVHDTPASELSRISAHEPDRLGDRHHGERIPLLAEACSLIDNHPGVTAFVEVKDHSVQAFGAAFAADVVIDVLSGVEHPERFVVISYNRDVLRRVRTSGPHEVGWVLRTWDQPARAAADADQPHYLFCNIRKVPPDDRPFWPGRWRWAVYEIPDADTALHWARRGAHMLETFRIAEILQDPAWNNGAGA